MPPRKTAAEKPPARRGTVEGAAPDSQTARATLSLRELLLEGRFQPGEAILQQVPLAAELSVSRSPLRIALERLSHEGLLEVRPTTGFVVAEFSANDIYDAIELRALCWKEPLRVTGG